MPSAYGSPGWPGSARGCGTRRGSRLWYLIQARHVRQASTNYSSDRGEWAGFPAGARRPWVKRTFLSHGRRAEVPPVAIANTADRWPHHGVANDPLSPSRATGCPVCPGYAGRLGTSMPAGLADCAAGAHMCPFCPDCPGGTAGPDHDHVDSAAYLLRNPHEKRNHARSLPRPGGGRRVLARTRPPRTPRTTQAKRLWVLVVTKFPVGGQQPHDYGSDRGRGTDPQAP